MSPLKNAKEFLAFHAVNARSPIVRQFRSTLVRECCINIDKSLQGFWNCVSREWGALGDFVTLNRYVERDDGKEQ